MGPWELTAAIGDLLDFEKRSRACAKEKATVKRAFTLSAEPKVLLSEDAFRILLALEGRRAERSQKAFALALLDLAVALTGESAAKTVRDVTSAVSASTRSTDFVGWYRSEKTLGVIYTELHLEKQHSVSKVLHSKITKAVHGVSFFSNSFLTVHTFPMNLDRDGLVRVGKSIA